MVECMGIGGIISTLLLGHVVSSMSNFSGGLSINPPANTNNSTINKARLVHPQDLVLAMRLTLVCECDSHVSAVVKTVGLSNCQ